MILSGKPYKPRSKFLWVTGKILREERGKAGLSQEELSKRARVSRGVLCDIELGKVDAKVETLRKICGAVGINFGVFMTAVMSEYDLG